MGKGSLVKELFFNIKTTGALTFSSKSLVNKMLSFADFSEATLIVELGGGDGSITKGIVERMRPDAKLLVFEINEHFCKNLEAQFTQPNVKIVCDSAEKLDDYLNGNKADLILSSLPFSLIPKDVRTRIIEKSSAFLHDKGRFIQILYAYSLKYHLAPYFKQIKTTFTLKNFPPTLIMICER
ncbi:hypothetical protein ADIS_1405 [Lunatimonas lonarensis]|uniref:Methyltransferase domain-containing protein n=1 Tax=Lunatimonas lonarensis TaxID=1232681 RepID=R7ZW21_9BACT|nr:methyltransferase domain-containing protein [Lunatimonas lonarensis]EON78208.1 hypothetical protein ADIS_1405 [Lunatimonas lonarensis]